MDEYGKYYPKWKKPLKKKSQKVCLCRDRKQLVGCQELEGDEMGRDCLMDTAFASGVMKIFGTRKRWWLHIMNVVNATELYTYFRLIYCYVNFTSIKNNSNWIFLLILCDSWLCWLPLGSIQQEGWLGGWGPSFHSQGIQTSANPRAPACILLVLH